MDTRLLTISLLLLFLEIGVLLGDLGLLPISLFEFQKVEWVRNEVLGKIEYSTNSVKRKPQHSFVWEETETKEQLFQYDSVLTLENSSATVELEGDISIKLFENTLIVIEPAEKTNNDKNIHLHFAKGDLRSILKSKKLKLKSKDWQFTAEKGSDIAFRSLPNDQMEVEVHKGSVELKHQGRAPIQVKQGTNIELQPTGEHKSFQQAKDLLWKTTKENIKLYTYNENKKISLEYEGKAEAVEILYPDKTKQKRLLRDEELTENQIREALTPGHYYLRLLSGNKVSRSQSIQIVEAPEWNYFYPFPRDRILNHKKNLFSWEPVPGAKKYRVDIQRSVDSNKAHESFITKKPHINMKLHNRGPLFWQVTAIDPDGAEMEGREKRLFYSIADALAAPILKDIKKKRLPASKEEPKPNKKPQKDKESKNQNLPETSFLEKLWNLILPTVYAQEKFSAAESFLYEFQWEKVEGADFYLIEISKSKDFFNILDSDKVDGKSYQWESQEQGEVYWRVAGGSNDGKMGFFSPPQKVNLANIKISKIKKQKVAEKPELLPRKAPTPKAISSQIPEKSIVIPESFDENKEVETNETQNSKMNPELEIVEIKKTDSEVPEKTHTDLALEVGLAYSIQRGKLLGESASYRFDGIVPIYIHWEQITLNESRSEKQSRLSFNYYRSEWEAKDPSKLILQKKVTEQKMSLSYQFLNYRDSLVGLELRQKAFAKRKAAEQLKYEDKTLIGISFWKQSQNSRKEFDEIYLGGSLNFGEKVSNITGAAEVRWNFKELNSYKMQLLNKFQFDVYHDSDSGDFSSALEFYFGLKVHWKNPKPEYHQKN